MKEYRLTVFLFMALVSAVGYTAATSIDFGTGKIESQVSNSQTQVSAVQPDPSQTQTNLPTQSPAATPPAEPIQEV
ncbi:MAG: hypothetical protein ACRCXZ_09125, partial [Patescibacteria group bacterium]